MTASVPVLVLRGDDPLGPWLRGERPLRIALGTDFSSATESAVRWLADFSKAGACELQVHHVAWPPEVEERFGVRGAPYLFSLDADAYGYLRAELQERLQPLDGKMPVRIHLSSGLGRPADHLLQFAEREAVDLVVVGSRQRAGLSRLRHGSVSQGVLQGASMPVACIPATRERDVGALPVVRKVLAPTDLSDAGVQAVRMAYGALGAGGTVRLLHVIPPTKVQDDAFLAEKRRLSEELRSLVPEEAEERAIRTEVEVVEATDVAGAIAQAAERFGADLLCLTTHGRTGLSKAIVGSVAQSLLAKSTRPILVVRPT